jgi:hypothetical protein
MFVKPTEARRPVPAERLPAEISEHLEVCKTRLIRMGYSEVERNLFDVNAPDCSAELDDMPAIVFECLFAEVI